jgi:predicted nucleic acid-binding protein
LIYVDSSVLLAELLDESRAPPPSLWENPLFSSRLTQYEVWTRLHRGRYGSSHGDKARSALRHVTLIDMLPSGLERALGPFPIPLRTLDALHLATVEFLRSEGHALEFATYDTRLIAAAKALGIKIAEI